MNEIKDVREGGHLVEQATECPDVRALVVGHLVDHLGAHVVGRADVCLREPRLAAQLLGQTEVTQLGVVLLDTSTTSVFRW